MKEEKEHKCYGRTDGYGGFTCMECHKYHPRQAALPQVDEVDLSKVATAIMQTDKAENGGSPMDYARTAWAEIRRQLDTSNGDYFTCRKDIAELSGFAPMAKAWDEHIAIVKDKLAALQANNPLLEQWQPIETAPKDGTEVLLGRFTHEKDEYHETVRVDWYRQLKDKRGYIGWGKFNAKFWPPTHWMPLPNPPKGDGE